MVSQWKWNVVGRGSWVLGRGWILLIGVNELLGGLSHYCGHA